MRLLVFGHTGQVASALAERGAARGHTVETLGRDRADLTDPASCADRVRAAEADVILNAAAYTNVDGAESDEETALTVNAHAPGAMATAAAARGLPFLHISTDYVFDGAEGRPWREDDPTGPISAYGRTKLAGETAVMEAGGPAAILRTAWVFSATGANFVKTMLRVGRETPSLKVVDDQRGGPTSADDIADALLAIAEASRNGRFVPGIFHFAGAPAVTWADFAEAIFADAGLRQTPTVTRITTAEFPRPAPRPQNSVLDCSKIAETYGIAQPDWRAALARTLESLA
ncbi:MAG: dTDP-4-dehydrorhamnose reductase [Pseudomonadota bacterium]